MRLGIASWKVIAGGLMFEGLIRRDNLIARQTNFPENSVTNPSAMVGCVRTMSRNDMIEIMGKCLEQANAAAPATRIFQ
jgi:hypothetical protein